MELARQITLMEFALFRNIAEREVVLWVPTEVRCVCVCVCLLFFVVFFCV